MAELEMSRAILRFTRIWWVLGTLAVVAIIGGATALFISSEDASRQTPSFEEEPAQKPERRADATEEFPNLSLSLVGIAVARIAANGRMAAFYGSGDEFATGARVVVIERSRGHRS